MPFSQRQDYENRQAANDIRSGSVTEKPLQSFLQSDGQGYVLKYSLDHIQNLLIQKQFFRLNRQYLINFQAVKEVEYFFARKLLVNLTIDIEDKLLAPREKVCSF